MDVLCTRFPFPVEKYWFLCVNVPLAVLCTFKNESTKYTWRYKLHPKVQSTPLSIYFWELGLNKNESSSSWEPLFWPQPKFHLGGWVCHQNYQNQYCLHIFCMSVSISARVHMLPEVLKSVLTVPMNIR